MERNLEQRPESLESLPKEIKKAVFIMYPDFRVTEGPDPKVIVDGKNPSDFAQEVFNRYEKILQAYKKNGFKIIGIVYNDTLPDKFSPLYPQKEFDTLLPVKTNIEKWDHENHQSLLEETLEKINFSKEAKIIVGGYHSQDCVKTMGEILKKRSLKVKINAELTEKQGEMFTFIRKANRVFSSSLKESQGDSQTFEQEIKDNREIKKYEIRRINSLLKK